MYISFVFYMAINVMLQRAVSKTTWLGYATLKCLLTIHKFFLCTGLDNFFYSLANQNLNL